MFLAAQLGALAVVVAGLLGAEPGVAHEAGNRVLLDAERRHHPGVDHVGRGGDDAHLPVHRHDHRVVDLQQVVVAGGIAGVGHLAVCRVERRDERQPCAFAIDVVVAPLPLVAGGLDRDVGGGGVLHRDDDARRRPGHEDDDDERHHGPDHFDRRALVEVGRLRTLALSMLEDRIEHHAEHADEDQQADDHHEVVQPLLVGGDARHRRVQIELIDRRPARQVVDLRPHRGREQRQRECRYASA